VEWEWLQHRIPAQLKVSPSAVLGPQKSRRGSMILDVSFPVLQQAAGKGSKRKRGERNVLHDSVVTDTTAHMAPEKLVKELGNVLSRLRRFMQEVPAEKHILFSKINLADRYWLMVVKKDSPWNFAYVLPGGPGTTLRLVILLAAKSFFAPLNKALRGLPNFVGLSRNCEVRMALLDAGALIKELVRRPTHVSELVAHDFDYVGFCEASAFGAGGVWFSGLTALPPTVWRVEFPADITKQVVSDKIPKAS
jgi:hypothetical protein